MNEIISNVVNNLINVLPKEAIVFVISMLPILELRGGMIAAGLLKIPYLKSVILCVIGNILPIPFVLFFLDKIFELMEKWSFTKKIALFFKNLAAKKKPQIDKYGFWGLVLFVGIPLPGTGAWTGSLVASVFHMDKKKASIAILIGIILVLIIMSLVYGLIRII